MSTLVNPQIEVKIFGIETLIIKDLFIDFDISKDIDEEPNEASLSISNLPADTRNQLVKAELVDVPIEIYLTKSGSNELTKAFIGEVDRVRNTFERPGHITDIMCTSQKSSQYSAYVDQLTFKRGTQADVIINKLAEAIDLPQQFPTLSTAGIPLSQSFTGLAFKQLQKFCTDYGYRVFISDGVLKIISIYEPQNLTPKVIDPLALLSTPISTRVSDSELLERSSVSETTMFDELAAKPKRRKRKKLSKKPGQNDEYIEYEAVEKNLDGWDLELLMQPDLQPDDLVTIDSTETKEQQLRIRSVNHHGNNESFDTWNTNVETTVYEAD